MTRTVAIKGRVVDADLERCPELKVVTLSLDPSGL